MSTHLPPIGPGPVPGVAGLEGTAPFANGVGVRGKNDSNGALGFLAGTDPVFQQQVGAYGQSAQEGVMGLATTDAGTGVYGGGARIAGVPGAGCIGVRGETFTGVGVQGQSFGNGLAGKFVGNVEVTGNINCHEGSTITCFDVSLIGADCAEEFDVYDLKKSEPGTVMVVDGDGTLRECDKAYDKRVAGVISGAGGYSPGIVLGKQQTQTKRLPIALVGKVYCKVDAQYSPIEIGDLLTTSSTSGHAMKADDPFKAFGAVIGKALRPLQAGQGLIPILIALQ